MAGDGWDDMDLALEGLDAELGAEASLDLPAQDESAQQELHLEESAHVDAETQQPDPAVSSVLATARRHAASGNITNVQGIFARERQIPEWQQILHALPETLSAFALRRLLPVPPRRTKVGKWRPLVHVPAAEAVIWYIHRAHHIIARTGLCGKALDILHHGIWAYSDEEGEGPSASEREEDIFGFVSFEAEQLPEFSSTAATEVSLLYGMFRLCAEYAKYCEVAFDNEDVITLDRFCKLQPEQRVHLVLQTSVPAAIVEDVKAWIAAVSIHECFAEGSTRPAEQAMLCLPEDWLSRAAADACTAPIESALMKAVVGKAADPTSFQLAAELVQASSPQLPRGERIVKDCVCLMEFIMESVYSDARCRAIDICSSVDNMFGCIPKADAPVNADLQKWEALQLQADELEGHLGCVEVLLKHDIKLSLSFSDLHSGCINKQMAIRVLWNLFRVLGARYRQAGFWRGFQKELFYLHTHAFAAVDTNTVYEMYCRCLVEQEHFQLLNEVLADWISACRGAERHAPVIQIAEYLVGLATEIVNSSPALRHESLERAKKLLRCVGQQNSDFLALTQSEQDFMKACELLHGLVNTHAGHLSRDRLGLERALDPARSQVHKLLEGWRTTEVQGPRLSAFSIHGPMQLRLQLHHPLRVVTDILQFNPAGLMASEQLQEFCRLLGLAPSSPCWAEVMAICGASNLLCGHRDEAHSITEKLLANGHPAAWKLAVALAFEISEEQKGEAESDEPNTRCLSVDHGLDLLADALVVCPPQELPEMLSFFKSDAVAESPPPVVTKTLLTEQQNQHPPSESKDIQDDLKQDGVLDRVLNDVQDKVQDAAHDDELDNSLLLDMKDDELNNLLQDMQDEGLLPTKDDELDDLLRDFQNQGQDDAHDHVQDEVEDDELHATKDDELDDLLRDFQDKGQDEVRNHVQDHVQDEELHATKDDELDDLLQNFQDKGQDEVRNHVQDQVQDQVQVDELHATKDDELDDLLRDFQDKAQDEARDHVQDDELHATKDDELDLLQDGQDELQNETEFEAQVEEDVPAVEDAVQEVHHRQIEPDFEWLDHVTSQCRWAEACPELDLSCRQEPLLEEVLSRHGGAAADNLIRSVAGHSSLLEAGVSTSAIAQAAALQEITSTSDVEVSDSLAEKLAPLLPWLSCEDALDILAATLNNRQIGSGRQAEVVAHIRAASAASQSYTMEERRCLEACLECAEMLRLLRSVCSAAGNSEALQNADFDSRQCLQEAGAAWLKTLEAAEEEQGSTDLVALAEAVLHGHEAWRQPADPVERDCP